MSLSHISKEGLEEKESCSNCMCQACKWVGRVGGEPRLPQHDKWACCSVNGQPSKKQNRWDPPTILMGPPFVYYNRKQISNILGSLVYL